MKDNLTDISAKAAVARALRQTPPFSEFLHRYPFEVPEPLKTFLKQDLKSVPDKLFLSPYIVPIYVANPDDLAINVGSVVKSYAIDTTVVGAGLTIQFVPVSSAAKTLKIYGFHVKLYLGGAVGGTFYIGDATAVDVAILDPQWDNVMGVYSQNFGITIPQGGLKLTKGTDLWITNTTATNGTASGVCYYDEV